jgi:hypothetical protein
MYTTLESINNETKTSVIFSTKQLLEVKNVREVLAVAVGEAADNGPTLNIAVFRLILRLITQNTSQLARYKPPVIHYLVV